MELSYGSGSLSILFNIGASEASTSISYDFVKSLRMIQKDFFFLLYIESEVLSSMTARNFSINLPSVLLDPILLFLMFNQLNIDKSILFLLINL
ncbi:MAG: hypothetical protein KAT57_00625 [Candidatus Lokiarchaeota archaeon]|nr:hypothetical protein [Candidatus Lokiarchaeota archaeon]MCK4480418.1 hypothetical protein [Candidatus Lokiarchaeota archaeon]MCK4778651.1 hypothetical protein [Candidatus Lokiarchaeota archaeon]